MSLSGRGHLFAIARWLFIAFLPLSSGQQIIFSSKMVTRKRLYEQEPCRGHSHRRSTLTVCPILRLPGPCLVIWKGDFFVFVTTPRLTTANSSKCENRGHLMFCILYLHMCTEFTSVHFSTTVLLDIEWIKPRWLPFLPKLYSASIKRPTSIKRSVFKVPMVAA